MEAIHDPPRKRAQRGWLLAAVLLISAGVAGAATKYVYDHYVVTTEDNGDGTEHVTIEDSTTGDTILDENLPKGAGIFMADRDESGELLSADQRMTIVVEPSAEPASDADPLLQQLGYVGGGKTPPKAPEPAPAGSNGGK
ncbi:MAG: hypothetical protein IPH13_21145 [Planctomycetes bacterium]|nr:hypothetical protein [Planctomycetota bacterium]MCC7170148.1 hypothetical protein [Planctomycetota bacterium]